MRQPLVAKVAQSGIDGNGLVWPAALLRESAHLFEGRPIYPKHEGRLGGGRHPSSIDRWGYLKAVQFMSTGSDEGYLAALVVPYDGRIEMLLREGVTAGRPWGLSAHVSRASVYTPKVPPKECPHARVLTAVKEVTSVDLVERPAMPGCRVLVEADGRPLRPDDQRVAQLLDGRAEAPDRLAMLETRLDRIVEAGNRKAAPRRRVVPLMETAIANFSDQAANAIVAAFTRRYGPGPWRVRSVG
jgi:hypothetical protein